MREEYEKLVAMVKKNVPDKEMMEKLGVQSKATLKKMYYDALVEAGKIKDILTEKEATKKAAKARTFSIGKRGTMTLSKALLVDELGFKEGDRFTASTRKGSIILRKE
jgi:formylmethanofuran dehydrogenase subunit D